MKWPGYIAISTTNMPSIQRKVGACGIPARRCERRTRPDRSSWTLAKRYRHQIYVDQFSAARVSGPRWVRSNPTKPGMRNAGTIVEESACCHQSVDPVGQVRKSAIRLWLTLPISIEIMSIGFDSFHISFLIRGLNRRQVKKYQLAPSSARPFTAAIPSTKRSKAASIIGAGPFTPISVRYALRFSRSNCGRLKVRRPGNSRSTDCINGVKVASAIPSTINERSAHSSW